MRRAEAADVVVLKVQPLGGVRACLRLAEEVGLPVVVSSALESSVGIAAGLALAAALPELPYACGLATVHLFERDTVPDPLLPVDGHLEVRRPEPTVDSLGRRGGPRGPGPTLARAAGRRWPSRCGPPRERRRRQGPRGPADVDPSTATARQLVTALVAHGVRHVVLAPGSRSAPLAYALLAAEEAGWLRLHVRVDERVAGFVALGLARAGALGPAARTRRPPSPW